MKLRIYFKPDRVVWLLVLVAAGFWVGVLSFHTWLRGPCLALAVFYSVLGTVSTCALWRCRKIERWISWDKPERLLILVPHQDDCVICAGGIGNRNQKLGGETHVVYLVQDDKLGVATRRKGEAEAAWFLAGVPAKRLQHFDLLPPLCVRDPQRLREAAVALQKIIDSIAPTVLILPSFEGGHIHHDVLNHLVTQVLKLPAELKVFECPEYSPYFSLRWTPHRVIAMCGRWLGGLVAYHGPPDGVDDRPIFNFALRPEEMKVKRQMLLAFESQHGDSLAKTRSYPDRFVEWRPRPFRPRPFAVEGSYAEFVRRLERWLPGRLVKQLFPGKLDTYGREPEITDLSREI